MRFHPLLWCLLLPLCVACQPHHPERSTAEHLTASVPVPDVSLERLLDSLSIHPDSVHFKLEKSKRDFFVLAHGKALKRYPCVLGLVPEGDKLMQGDRRTPEGTFTFRDKYPHREWHKFVWVDYPNAESRRNFQERKRNGIIPADADIGGEIGIHGVPSGMDRWIEQGNDWTFGCIALRNADLDEIYRVIKPRMTTITIVP